MKGRGGGFRKHGSVLVWVTPAGMSPANSLNFLIYCVIGELLFRVIFLLQRIQICNKEENVYDKIILQTK